jgi:hypothetical protein
MTAKFSLMARVGGKFITVEIKHGTPIAPAGASSYYVRFTDDAGKRQRKPLGKDLSAALIELRKMETAREETRRLAVQSSQPTFDSENLILTRLRKEVARLTVGFEALAETQSKQQGELASLWVLVNQLRDPKGRESRIEKHMSLREAARRSGVGSKSLKRWMAAELRICFPRTRHGEKILVRERDVEYVLARHRDARNVRAHLRSAQLF